MIKETNYVYDTLAILRVFVTCLSYPNFEEREGYINWPFPYWIMIIK